MCKPKVVITKTIVLDLPEEIQGMLDEFGDIVVDDLLDEFPPKRDVNHQIDFIPGASLPNKASYRLIPHENEEVKKQVQGFMDKGLVNKSLSPCAVLVVLSPKETMTRDPKETLPLSTETQALVHPVTPTPLSSKVPDHEISEESIPLSEYKFDHSKLVVVKRPPKHKRTLVGGVEKALIEGYKKSTLWDISGPDVARVGVETSTMIDGMALIGQSSLEAMEKQILNLKQLVVQTQNELTNSIKHTANERQRSFDELKITLTV